MPWRTQRRRSRGWRMPEGAVYVGRPTKWGNPWPVGRPGLNGETMPTAEAAVERYERAIDIDPDVPGSIEIRRELRGLDLVCWCGPDQPCHADVLMKIANDANATQYRKVIKALRSAYDRSAGQRDATPKTPWKLAERQAFLARLQTEGKTRLLEIGAGTGHDSLFFEQNGLTVVATDLSPEMVERCRAKGLEAHTMDFLHLDFEPASFDAIYAINCLLHVPNADLPTVLSVIRSLMAPGGLFFLGLYGDAPYEGIDPNDWHDPPRFFSFRSDEQMQSFVREHFEIVDFHIVEGERFHFQSLTLRAPADVST